MKAIRCEHLRYFCVLVSALICPFCAHASPAQASDTLPNGISVGAPKVFDNRTLTLMLQNLEDALHSVQFIDQRTLAAALGTDQGLTSTEFTTNFTVSTLPTQAAKQQDTPKNPDVNSLVQAAADKTDKTSTNKGETSKGSAPSSDNGAFPPGFKPQFEENASDLLGDQVNLTYQMFNLRMLLERSLTDRLWNGGSHPSARLQAVLGFNVTIDPPRTANDAVAVVEITLDRETAGDSTPLDGKADSPRPLSLISLMPQEKTYNSAALSTKAHSYGGSAVVKVLQIGYTQSRKSQTFYLYRDADTVSYEVMHENSDNLIFGWMFRPVLGRRSVSPGLRQLFAIVALPDAELCAKNDSTNSEKLHCPVEKLHAHVKTYWKKYDAATLTAFQPQNTNRALRFKFAASLSLAKPEIFSARYENVKDYSNVDVLRVEDYEQALRPIVHGVTWRSTGPNTVLISVAGENFFNGTKVTIGGTVFTGNGDGMIIKSNQSLDLVTSIDTLAAGSGAVIGRYGVAIPLLDKTLDQSHRQSFPLHIAEVTTDPVLNGYSQGLITFCKSESCEDTVTLPELRSALPLQRLIPLPHPGETTLDPDTTTISNPIISLNGNAIPPPYSYVEIDKNVGAIQVNIPESYFSKGGGLLRISWPFLPPDGWTRTQSTFEYTQAFKLTRLSADRLFLTDQGQLHLWKNGAPCWYIAVGGQVYQIEALNCKQDSRLNSGEPKISPISLSGDGILLKLSDVKAENLVMFQAGKGTADAGISYSLAIPKSTDEAKAATKAIQVNQYDSRWVEICGKDFSRLASAEVNGIALRFRRPPDLKPEDKLTKVQVQLTRTVTNRPGTVDITLTDASGKVLTTAQVDIASSPGSTNKISSPK